MPGTNATSPWRSTAALLRERAGDSGSREAVIDGAVRLSYATLATRVGEAARAFIASGIAKGDRIAIWGPNSHEWIVVALGAQAAGAVIVPINTRFRGQEALDIIARSGARLLFTLRGFLGTDYPALLREALTAASTPTRLEATVILRGEAETEVAWDAFLARGAAVSEAAALARETEVGPDDIADIMFTSGTTGRPKGAMLTHGQMLRTYAAVCELLDLRADDRYLIIAPFFHTFGYRFGFITTLIAGAAALPLAQFEVPEVLRLVERERVTLLPGPPTLFHSLLEHPERGSHDLSSLRLTLLGAANVPAALVRRLREELPFETIITGYGLTESCGVASICRRGDDAETVAGTSGCAFPGVELRVVDADGRECACGESGEVRLRGYNVMVGYLDDPAATAAAITPDGWLCTGDIGVMDERGYLRILDRLKDMYIVGGFNAYPAEIEGMLLKHPGIAQAAVVGMPDERLGEVGRAFVIRREGNKTTAEELIVWCRENMANFKVPRRIEFVDALPMNASGKVLKYELREPARKSGT